jgi:hypothetical protein
MAERKVVLLETDDLMHDNSGESNFNESAYYNFYDRNNRVGGFVRMGNRPNEGNAEMTVCVYLPDSSVGFMFKRPEISNNDAHNAGGLKFEVVKPFEHHRVSYQGKLCMLKNPLEMAEPTVAFKNNPYAACELRLDYRGTAPGWGGELREKTASGWESLKPSGDATQQFAKGHLEQLGHATGSIKIDGTAYDFKFDGLGLRDHSWGPRYWQAPKYYRWLTMNFDEGIGGMASITVNRDGSEHPGGFMMRKGQPTLNITKVDLETEFAGEQQLHDRIKVTCATSDGGAPIVISGKVLSMIPLRNRRAGMITRIAEGMTEWRWDDKVGYGLAEYLDHLQE